MFGKQNLVFAVIFFIIITGFRCETDEPAGESPKPLSESVTETTKTGCGDGACETGGPAEEPPKSLNEPGAETTTAEPSSSDPAPETTKTNTCGDGVCETGETPSSCPSDCWKITTFGLHNTQEWKDNLPITGLRMGSSYPADKTIANARAFVKDHGLKKVFIAISAPRSEDETLYFSKESLSFSELEEVGIDDFAISWHNKWSLNQDLLNNFIGNLKSHNPNLKFGITLYEDHLDAPDLGDAKLPKAIKNRIDSVHLFLHYRKNVENYASYVDKAKSMFPNAKIIVGSYAYDRIDYITCSQSSADHCTWEEELSYFKDSITIQADLLRKGAVDSIEFVPAYFGNEDDMSEIYFPNPKYCKTERKQACIENTKILRASALSILNAKRSDILPNQ